MINSYPWSLVVKSNSDYCFIFWPPLSLAVASVIFTIGAFFFHVWMVDKCLLLQLFNAWIVFSVRRACAWAWNQRSISVATKKLLLHFLYHKSNHVYIEVNQNSSVEYILLSKCVNDWCPDILFYKIIS